MSIFLPRIFKGLLRGPLEILQCQMGSENYRVIHTECKKGLIQPYLCSASVDQTAGWKWYICIMLCMLMCDTIYKHTRHFMTRGSSTT